MSQPQHRSVFGDKDEPSCWHGWFATRHLRSVDEKSTEPRELPAEKERQTTRKESDR